MWHISCGIVENDKGRKPPINMMPEGITLDNLSNYIITEEGKVWSKIRNRYLKGQVKDRDYRSMYLKQTDTNISKWFYLHRLVALAYHENPNNYPIVLHKDNDPSNNHKNNLKWGTHKENTQHAIESGSFDNMPKGKNHWLYGVVGPEHPTFKGYYSYQGIESTSISSLAIKLGTYPMRVKRMYDRGEIIFTPKQKPIR